MLKRKATAARKAAEAKATAAVKAAEAAKAAAAQAKKAAKVLAAAEKPSINGDGADDDDDDDNDVEIVPSVVNFAEKAKILRDSELKSWSLVKARDRKKIVPIVGTCTETSVEGVAPVKRDFWELSVSRLKEDTTSDKLKTFLQGRGIEVRDAFVFSSKVKGTAAAKVRVALEHRDRAKDASIWPSHIRVQDCIYKPKSAKKENVASI